MGLGDALRQALAPLADRVHLALVYGSWARGEEVADSDLDLLLIGDLKLREAATVLGPVGRQLGREFNRTRTVSISGVFVLCSTQWRGTAA